MKKILITAGMILLAWSAGAQIKEAVLDNGAVRQYERADFTVKLTGNWQNPYLQEEAALDMHIITPSGGQLILPCYWESGESGTLSQWKARFTPRESGEYRYTFRYSENGEHKSESQQGKFTSMASSGKGFLLPGGNWVLRFDNGTPFRGVGENICWESRNNDDSRFFKDLHEMHAKYNYDYLLPQFAGNGGNFIRVWMCGWNFPIDSKGPINNPRYTPSDQYYNPSALARMDHFVDLCEELDIYVMLCMGAGAVQTDHNFFISDEAKTRYKNRARYIMARWGYSPSIAYWELFNEIDNIQYRRGDNPIPTEDIVAWHSEMSRYFKETDPYRHMVTTSISHRDLKGLNSIEYIDLNQKHIYKNTSGMPLEIIKYQTEFGKPYVIGEFGFEWDWSKDFDEFAEDMDLDFKRGLWYGIFSPTPITPMSWWWEYFENRGLVPYFRGVRLISDRMLADGGGEFESLSAKAAGTEAFSVKCGDILYAYIYNQTGKKVEDNLVINHLGGDYTVQSFNPTTLEFRDEGTVSARTGLDFKGVSLEDRSEIVYIFTPAGNR